MRRIDPGRDSIKEIVISKMRSVLAFVMLLAWIACSGSRSFYRVPIASQDSTQLKVGIWLDKSSYDRGEILTAYIFLKNESKNVIFLNARFAGDFFDREGGEVSFEIDPDPRTYFRTVDYVDLTTKSVQILYPGEKVTCLNGFVLTHESVRGPFRFPPGKYKLRAVYTNTYQSKAYGLWTGKIKSEPFEFEVH
jgi:hypothetical protein